VSEFSASDATAFLLGLECQACGARLLSAGVPCGQCDHIPDVTAPELEAELAAPAALAAVEAKKIEAEALELRSQMLARYAERDRVLHVGRLEQKRHVAQAALERAVTALEDKQRELAAPLKAARKAEARAARELQAAVEEHAQIAHAEAVARRMKHGLRAEAQAAVLLAKAAEGLQRYQNGLAKAAGDVAAMESELAALQAVVAQREQARDQAAAVMNPGRIPVSPETLAADPVRLLLSGELDETETLMAQLPARFLAAMTGLAGDIQAEARAELLAEQERDHARNRALWSRTDGAGNLTTISNPAGHPSVPAQFHPPGPGAGANPTPPLVGGFG
jgi:hypothetical protein